MIHVKLIKAHIMQEHIDAAEVVSCNIDFLSVEAISDGILAEKLFRFQKQKTIHQEDKFVDLSCIDDFEGMRWDFREIDNVVNQRIDFSKEFLQRSLQG